MTVVANSLVVDKAARLQVQTDQLGEGCLKRLADETQAAKDSHDEEMPETAFDSFAPVSARSARFHKTTTARAGTARQMGTSLAHTQLPIDFDDPENTVPLPYTSYRYEYDKTNSELLRLSVSLEDWRCLDVVRRLHILFFRVTLDPERIKAIIAKNTAGSPETLRDGESVLDCVLNVANHGAQSLMKATDVLIQLWYLERLQGLLESHPARVVQMYRQLYRALHRPENFRIFVCTAFQLVRAAGLEAEQKPRFEALGFEVEVQSVDSFDEDYGLDSHWEGSSDDSGDDGDDEDDENDGGVGLPPLASQAEEENGSTGEEGGDAASGDQRSDEVDGGLSL